MTRPVTAISQQRTMERGKTMRAQEADQSAIDFIRPPMTRLSVAVQPKAAGIGRTAKTAKASGDEIPLSMVERMTLIMEAFTAPQERLTLEELTSWTHLPRSTIHRILDQLVRLSWLDRHGRHYALGERSLTLGGLYVGENALRASASPILQMLAARSDMVVHLVVLDGADVCYLDRVGQVRTVNVPSRVGGRMPAHCTAAGKSILASLPPEQVDALYSAGIPGRTGRSINDLRLLHEELSRIRSRNRLAFERGECTPNVACVGAAVRGPGGPLGAISIAGDVQAPLERLAPLVQSAVQAVARMMGGESRRRRQESNTAPCNPSSDTLDRLVAMAECGEWA